MQKNTDKLIQEFHTLTGLTLQADFQTMEEERFFSGRVESLLNIYKKEHSVEHFLLLLLRDQVDRMELKRFTKQFHLNVQKPRQLYLIRLKSDTDEMAIKILRSMFPQKNRDFLITVDEQTLALLYEIRDEHHDSDSIAKQVNAGILAEAMSYVNITYSKVFSSLQLLPSIYQSCLLSLNIGMIFYSDRMIIPYNELGIGRLIYQLPIRTCENYLKETVGEDFHFLEDSEVQHTINTFISNNLNLAETARKLHMHRNTLVYRIEQMERLLGLELKTIDGAMTFKITTMVANYLKFIKENKHE